MNTRVEMNTFKNAEFEKDVINRLSNLETHLINFILPIQDIRCVSDKLSKPIVLDDRRLFNTLTEFKDAIGTLINFFKITDISKINEGLNPFVKNLEKLNQTLGEIKYIGNRLNKIEKILEEIRKEGVEKKIRVDLTLDGYEMTKKKKKIDEHDDEQENEHDQERFLRELLLTLSEREYKVLIHRFGLLGQKKKTQDTIGKLFSLSRERIRQIELKALRKLRHPTRIEKVRLLAHIDLRTAVIGE